MSKGIFTISLDFELHWGGFEKWPEEKYQTYFSNTRRVIPEMLELFRKYEVHVTWATVGMLFFDAKAELEKAFPSEKPAYDAAELSAYNYITSHGIGNSESEDGLHYGRSLIRKIINTPHQEVGTHTFAHYYCNEKGQTLAQFQADITAAKKAAKEMNVELRSLVFPRNQFNRDYLKVCFDEGIVNVRSNPDDWFWKIDSALNESKFKRFARGLDAYFGTGQKKTYSPSSVGVEEGLPVCIPASRLLRPHGKDDKYLRTFKLRTIKSELKQAARDNEAYHLWWHPHNFGWNPDQNLDFLERILKHFAEMKSQYGLRGMTMQEFGDYRRSLK